MTKADSKKLEEKTWKGSWKCTKCGAFRSYPQESPHARPGSVPPFESCIGGEWKPYERRRLTEQDREIERLNSDLTQMNLDSMEEEHRLNAELSACKERVRELEETLERIKLQPQECQRIMAKHGWKYDDSEDFNQKMIFTMYDHVVQCAVEAEQALEAQEQSKEVGR